jgi:hypothetical protein
MPNRWNLIPAFYGVAILIGFLISNAVGVVVLIGGAALSGLAWSATRRTSRGGVRRPPA